MEDSNNLKELWIYIAKTWTKIDKIMATPVHISYPTKYLNIYNECLEELNGLPNKFRTYEALVSKKNQIGENKKINQILMDLKSEAIKEHHWS